MDERLSQALRSLPTEKASADFTARVLERTRTRPRSTSLRSRPRYRPLLLAALPLLLCLALAGGFWRQQQAKKEILAKLEGLEALKQETAALKAELQALRRIKAAAEPTLFLGEHADLELVLDLSRLGSVLPGGRAQSPGPPNQRPTSKSSIRPAVQQTPQGGFEL